MLGADSNNLNQLALDIDVLRVTRRALLAGEELPANYAEPPRYPAATFSSDAPNSIDGLQLWLPAFDPTYAFRDINFADTLPLNPVVGTAVMSMFDASSNQYRVAARNDSRYIYYSEDTQVGASYQHSPDAYNAGRPWVVQNSNGSGAKNFDFVQNTGVFTLSTFVKLDSVLSSQATLFDTNSGSSNSPGFSLAITNTGALKLQITGTGGLTRYTQTTVAGLITGANWYHVAVVGTGVGQPVRYYVTPATASAVSSFAMSTITGADGNYATGQDQNLSIGARTGTSGEPVNGRMVDQAVYNRALSPAEIQQLFAYTNKLD
jgi:hypothetical protein